MPPRKLSPRQAAKKAKPTQPNISAVILPEPAKEEPSVRGKPFMVGYDPRRNLNGRPKDHDELKELIREIGATLAPNGTELTRLQSMILLMFMSKNPSDHITLLEHAFGKVPQEISVTWREKAKELGYDPDELIHKFATVAALGTGSGGAGSDGTPIPAEPDAGGGSDAL